jgi:putative MFS transporter
VFFLLFLRISVYESGMYQNAKMKSHQLGNFRLLIRNKETFIKYISIILIAVPIWYIVQLYSKYAPELAEAIGLHVSNKKDVAIYAIMSVYSGLTLGDVSCGLLSNYIKSRKKAILSYLILLIFTVIIFWQIANISFTIFYIMIFLLGFGIGYWAVFMSTASESFGINIRSTVTNTAPNFVRGFVVIINSLYIFFKNQTGSTMYANILVGIICIGLALFAWTKIEETFGKDLDYIEK